MTSLVGAADIIEVIFFQANAAGCSQVPHWPRTMEITGMRPWEPAPADEFPRFTAASSPKSLTTPNKA